MLLPGKYVHHCRKNMTTKTALFVQLVESLKKFSQWLCSCHFVRKWSVPTNNYMLLCGTHKCVFSNRSMLLCGTYKRYVLSNSHMLLRNTQKWYILSNRRMLLCRTQMVCPQWQAHVVWYTQIIYPQQEEHTVVWNTNGLSSATGTCCCIEHTISVSSAAVC